MKYYIRLDDACERMDVNKWARIESILDEYNIVPLVGVIPKCEDKKMNIYSFNCGFWEIVNLWVQKGWVIAMHGYNHVYSSLSGGINPVNNKSEFAGLDYDQQASKIRNALEVFRNHNIDIKVFFAPSHTFDKNTLKAIKNETDIRIISDTIAFKSYCMDEITFVPQQSGNVRFLPFGEVTFCYHPNTMNDEDFDNLSSFLSKNKKYFCPFPTRYTNRKKNVFDRMLSSLYFQLHRRSAKNVNK